MTKYESLQKMAADRDYKLKCYEENCEQLAVSLIKGFMNYLGCPGSVVKLVPYDTYDEKTSYTMYEAMELGKDRLKRFGILLILGKNDYYHIKFKIGKVNGKYYIAIAVGEENQEFFLENDNQENLSIVYNYIYCRFEEQFKAEINADI